MATRPDDSFLWGGRYQPDNNSGLYDGLDELGVLGSLSSPKSEMSEYIETLSFYLMGVGGSTICCLGTVANALSIAVLTRRSMRSSTYTYLAALAACDTLVLFLTLIIIIDDTKPPDSLGQVSQFHAVLFPFVHPSAVVFQVTSIWLTMAFTVDRYIMICHPFQAEAMCRRSRAMKVIVCLYAAGLVFNIPRFLEYSSKLETVAMTNSSQVISFYGIHTTALGNTVLFRELIHSWLYLLFICGIPFLVMVVLNAFLIRAVHLSRLRGKEINPREKHRNDTTVMLIGVIVIFLLCQGPALVSRMIYAFQPVAASSTKAVITLNEVANFLVYLNSAVNIVPYYLFGRKFRSEFWRIFCACCFDQDELRRINRSYSLSVDQRRMSQYNVMEMNGLLHSKENNSALGVDIDMNGLGGRCVHNSGQRCILVTRETTFLLHGQSNGSVAASLMHSQSQGSVAAPLLHSQSNGSVAAPLLHSQSNGSVAAPLMHGMYHSMSSHMVGHRKPGASSANSSTESVSCDHGYTNPSGPPQYMTVASGTCMRGPQGSAV